MRYAQATERGEFQFLFVPNFPALKGDIETEAPMITIDPMMTLAAVARNRADRDGRHRLHHVQRSLHLARQFKALDLMSHGRAGWNAVPTRDPAVAATYGRELPPRAVKYERLHESIQIV